MLTPTIIPCASTLQISASAQSPITHKNSIGWTLITHAILATILVVAGMYGYNMGIEWWNTQVYLKRQSTEIDVSKPVFSDAIVDWAKKRAGNQPNTSQDMLRQIVVIAFDESAKRDVDPLLTLAVIAAESQFNYMATSPSGAKGLMQVIPFWHKDKIAVVEAYDPVANIRAGTAVIAEYMKNHKGNVRRALLNYNGSLEIPGANYDTKVLSLRDDLSKHVTSTFVSAFQPTLTSTTSQKRVKTNNI